MKKPAIFLWGGVIIFAVLFSCSKKEKTFEMMEINVNWLFKASNQSEWIPASVPGTVHTDLLANQKIEDPFFRDNEKSLQWIDKKDWEYKTTFKVTNQILSKDRVELYFKGLDTYTDIYLNDSLLISTNNMFREWRVDCKKFLKIGENNLLIYFHSPVKIDLPKLEVLGYALPASNDQSENGGLGNKKISPFARKAPYHYGWDWGPRFVTSGIWRPVYLQAFENARLMDVFFKQQELTPETAKILAINELEIFQSGKYLIEINDYENDIRIIQKTNELKPGKHIIEIPFEIDNPKLWWPNGLGEAFLYSFKVSLKRDNKLLDMKSHNIGLRTIRLIRENDRWGKSFYFEVNGKPVFSKGANYIPNDIFLPRVGPEKYEYIIKSAVDANMNMLRVWGGGIYENDIFYDLCDKYGIMVWQDFMFACSMYPGDDAFLENVRHEAIQNVKRLRNHPSIVLWCGNNEIDVAWSHDTPGGWGWKERYTEEIRKYIWQSYDTLFHKILPEVVNQYDPQRSYWPSSPLAEWGERASYSSTSGDMHYWGVWHGKEKFEKFKVRKARFMSEFGFQSFPELKTVKKYTIEEDRKSITTPVMNAHQRSGIGNERIREYMNWYYRTPEKFEDMLYLSQVLQAEGMKIGFEAHRRAKPYCMGSLYWQLNDCWPVASWSGIDYYGRKKAMHYFIKKAFEDILISPSIENDSLKIYIVSDLFKNLDGSISLQLFNFSGRKLWEKNIKTRIPANSSQIYFSESINSILNDIETETVFLYVSLKNDIENLTDNIIYFNEVKNLNLPDCNIHLDIYKEKERYVIYVSADKLAKNLFLNVSSSEGHFSDNYFDLLPGEKKKLYFYDFEKGFQLDRKSIQTKTVRDTY